MSLISRWYSSTLAFATDDQNTPEIDLLDSFEAIEIDIPTIEAAEIQIKCANDSGGTFDLIAQEEPVPSSTGGFRTTVPLGGKYQFIKVFLSAAQSSDRAFSVRGISYASGGLVTLIDRIKQLLTGIILAAGTAVVGRFGHDITGIDHGVETVDSAGTHQAIVTSSTPAKGVIVQAQTDNTNAIAVGATGVDAVIATGTGIILYAGDSVYIPCDDLAEVFIDALVTNEGVRFTYFT